MTHNSFLPSFPTHFFSCTVWKEKDPRFPHSRWHQGANGNRRWGIVHTCEEQRLHTETMPFVVVLSSTEHPCFFLVFSLWIIWKSVSFSDCWQIQKVLWNWSKLWSLRTRAFNCHYPSFTLQRYYNILMTEWAAKYSKNPRKGTYYTVLCCSY